jgi:uncharacterized integral membrane protein
MARVEGYPMRRFLILFIVVPMAIIIVALSVANRGPVTLSFDPLSDPPLWSLTMPLFLLLFVIFGLGALSGGIAAWLRQSKWRRTARAERAKALQLRQELERLRQNTTSQPILPAVPAGHGARDAA